MVNRKSLNAKKYSGKKYSFQPKKTNSVIKKKNVADPKDKLFEILWGNYFGENYIENWYKTDFRDALNFYKKFNSEKRQKISKQIIRYGKETSDEEKNKISFTSVLQNTATFLNFQINKDFKYKSKNNETQVPTINPNMAFQEYRKSVCDYLEKEGLLNTIISEKIYSFKKDKAIDVLFKKLLKEKKQILQHFNNRQKDCVKRLGKVGVSTHVIQALIQVKNIAELEKILDTLPPILLIKAGVLKTKHGDTYFTKKSIKAISTPMRG